MTTLHGPGPAATTPGLAEIARIGVSLRWRLVANRANRAGRRSPRLVYIMSALYAVANIASLASSRFFDESAAERTLVLVLSSLASGWIFGPILIGGVDETVDPTRLALLPLRRRELFGVQVAASLSGAGPLAALVSLGIGIPLGFAPANGGAILAFMAAPISLLIVVGLARSVAAAMAIAQRSRIGRDLAVLAAALLAGALFVCVQLAMNFSGNSAARLVDALSWTPWCWPIRGLLATVDGHHLAGAVWMAVSAAAAVAALTCWSMLSMFLLTNGERVVRAGRRGHGPALGGATTVLGAAIARQWIYLRRSPNTRVALTFGIAFGVAFPVLQIIQYGASGSSAAAFGALLAMLANIGATSNLLGFDAGSLWLEALCGGPRRVHMAARSIAALPNLLLPTWLSGIVVGVWTGQWHEVALVSAVAVPVAFIVLAQGLATSILAPWPLPDRDNPFGNRQAADGRGATLAVTALSGLAGALLLSAPIITAAYLGRDHWWAWLCPAIGSLWAGALFLAALAWVGRRLDGREPELVELLSPLAVN